jgi:F0F1-type ATP synthase epsilon subunit
MKLEIVSSDAHNIYQVAWLELNTPVGNFIIQQGHAPMILSLTPNKPITFRLKSGKQQTINANSGIAKITREATTLIIDTHHELPL